MIIDTDVEQEAISFSRLSKDIRDAAKTLSDREARYLVDLYYQLQEYRKAGANQVRSMAADEEPHVALAFFADQMRIMEKSVAGALDKYSAAQPLGEWARSIIGIGPVITAGLLAHIDIAKAPTAGHIWRFAGLDPTQSWEKGQKRPWNADLKMLCWKIGESFVKVSGNEKSYYGKVYVDRKAMEIKRNDAVIELSHSMMMSLLDAARSKVDDSILADAPSPQKAVIDGEIVTFYKIGEMWYGGGNAMHAHDKLVKFKIGKDTDAYASYSIGKLPPAHIHARAKRYAVKLFIAHYQEVGYRQMHNAEPPLPYPIAILGHAHLKPASEAA